MDTQWLTAPEDEVEAAIDALEVKPDPPPPAHGDALFVLTALVLGVAFGVVWLVFAARIDASEHIPLSALRDLVIAMVVLALCCYASVLFSRWRARVRARRANPAWREHLTALANDLSVEPVHRATFASLITGSRRTARCVPRFVGTNFELGNLTSRRYNVLQWHYLAVRLPAPLPQMLLEASRPGPLPRDLPRPKDGQLLTVGGQFDRRFTTYGPSGYGLEVMYVLSPVLMAALIDHGAAHHLEITGDTAVFFAPDHADFSQPGAWLAAGALAEQVVPALTRQAERYHNERGASRRSRLRWRRRPVSGSLVRDAAKQLTVLTLLMCVGALAFLGLLRGIIALVLALLGR